MKMSDEIQELITQIRLKNDNEMSITSELFGLDFWFSRFVDKHNELVELNKELLWELKTLQGTMKAILEDPEVLNVYRRHFDHRGLESTRALIVKSERLNQ